MIHNIYIYIYIQTICTPETETSESIAGFSANYFPTDARWYVPMDPHSFSGISRRTVTFPMGFHQVIQWQVPTDLRSCELWRAIFCAGIFREPGVLHFSVRFLRRFRGVSRRSVETAIFPPS